MEFFLQLNELGTTVLIASHDLESDPPPASPRAGAARRAAGRRYPGPRRDLDMSPHALER
jgi:hypothetical protein